jgi:site-specific DNA-cytosine methylase
VAQEFAKRLDNRFRFFILENVAGIMDKQKGKDAAIKMVLDMIEHALSEDWEIRVFQLNSTQFFLPQNRPRVYIVGRRHDMVKTAGRITADGRKLWDFEPEDFQCGPGSLTALLDRSVESPGATISKSQDANLASYLKKLHPKMVDGEFRGKTAVLDLTRAEVT